MTKKSMPKHFTTITLFSAATLFAGLYDYSQATARLQNDFERINNSPEYAQTIREAEKSKRNVSTSSEKLHDCLNIHPIAECEQAQTNLEKQLESFYSIKTKERTQQIEKTKQA